MKSRFLITGFFLETNSFTPLPTGMTELAEGLVAPDKAAATYRDTGTELGGALRAAEEANVDVAFLPILRLPPGGTMTGEALAAFLRESERAWDTLPQPPNGVLAILHGCTAAENEPDATGFFLERLRRLAGGVPIVGTADFHANMTERALRALTLVVGYRTYPHSDLAETGERAARRLQRLLAGELAPTCVRTRLPLIVPTETSEHAARPLREVWAGLAAIEKRTGWPASCFCPHPWLDVPEIGVTLTAYARTPDVESVGAALRRVARNFWNDRQRLYAPMKDLEAGWREIEAGNSRPALLVDSGDVVLAGAPGDSTAILSWLAGKETQLRCLLHITDPVAAMKLADGAPGDRVTVTVGSRSAAGSVSITAAIARVTDATYTSAGPYEQGIVRDPGRRVVLGWRGHTLVLAARRDSAQDPAFWRSLGLRPEEFDVVVVKSHNTFRPAYAAISRNIVRVATAGATSPNLMLLPYRGGNRDHYPRGTRTIGECDESIERMPGD